MKALPEPENSAASRRRKPRCSLFANNGEMATPSPALLWKLALFVGPLLAIVTLKTQFVSLGTAADGCITLWAFSIGGAWAASRCKRSGCEIRISRSEVVLLALFAVAILVDLIHRTAQPAFWTEAAAWLVAFFALRRILSTHPHAAEGLVWGLLAAFLVEVGWAAAQFAGWMPALTPDFPVTGGFDNPAGLALATFAALPALTVWHRHAKRWAVAACAVTGLLITAILWLTASRTALLAWTAALGVNFLKGRTGRTWLRGWRLAAAGSVLLLLVGTMCLAKPASTSGRALIYRCTASLVADAPWTGRGTPGFVRDYMPRQAEWLRAHGAPRTRQLAGQVRHPLSEYLAGAVAYGLPWLFAAVGCGLGLLLRARRQRQACAWALPLWVALAVLALFSYPLHYALGRLLALAALAGLCREERTFRLAPRGRTLCLRLAAAGCAVGLLLSATTLVAEGRWNRVAREALAGHTPTTLERYGRLVCLLPAHADFLYNYAAELYVAGHYAESADVLRRCRRYRQDPDVELLDAALAVATRRYGEARTHLFQAHAMIPSLFTPLHTLLMQVYLPSGDTLRARRLARHLLDKEVKVPSPAVSRMKADARLVLWQLSPTPSQQVPE